MADEKDAVRYTAAAAVVRLTAIKEVSFRIDDKPGVGTTRRDPVQIRERFMHGMGVRQPL